MMRAVAAAVAVMAGGLVLLVLEIAIRELVSFDSVIADRLGTLFVALLATIGGAGYLARGR
jgi:hypothetical protein